MVAIHAVYYNFARVHKTLRITPAMAAGLSDHVWSLEEIVLFGKSICGETGVWWDHQKLNKPRKDKTGKRWNFRVWHDVCPQVGHVERVFFWDDKQEFCGVVIVSPGIHVSRLHTLIQNLLADPSLRKKHQRELRFPLERHYSEYGVSPKKIRTETLPRNGTFCFGTNVREKQVPHRTFSPVRNDNVYFDCGFTDHGLCDERL